jgi:PAS domain S-box-containing protein
MGVPKETFPESLAKDRKAFETLFESSPDPILVAGMDGRIARINAQAEKLFGYTREELVGQPVEILVPEKFRDGHPARRQAYSADPHVRPMGAGLELFGMRKDGTKFPVDIMLSPVETSDGRYVLSVVRDITERKRAEAALRESEHRLQGIIDNSTAVIYLKDLQGRYLTINRQFESLFGVKRSDAIGKTDHD